MKLILGHSQTGASVARFLERQGEPFVIYDDKNPMALPPYDVVIKSPGVPLDHPLCIGKKVIGELDLFKPQGKVIAITGSSGKTTIATLIYELLKYNGCETVLGGNIGVPVLDLPTLSSKGIYVLELSSFQLETNPDFNIDIAILLNLVPNHLDRHKTMENYAAAKLNIFNHAKVGIVGQKLPYQYPVPVTYINRLPEHSEGAKTNIESAYSSSMSLDLSLHCVPFKKTVTDSLPIIKTSQEPRDILEAVATLLDLPKEGVDVVLSHFKGIEHRLEVVATKGNTTFINDSKGTTFFAVGFAINKVKEQGLLHLIMGGGIKEYDAAYLEPFLKHVHKLYIFGPNKNQFIEMLSPYYHKEFYTFNTLDDVFANLMLDPLAHNTVLMSNGGTSYDLYKVYTERGDHFKRLVMEQTK